MTIAIGSDHAGFPLKHNVQQWLEEAGHTVINCGTDSPDSVDYPDYAAAVAREINEGRAALGILMCSTGQGIAMAANKIRGIRAALCTDSYSARLTREHNDANVLVMGAQTIGPAIARDCLEAFVNTPFSQGERHARRIAKMSVLEQTL